MATERPPVRFLLDVSQETYGALMVLGQSGIFGQGPEKVADELIRNGISQLSVEGWLPMPGPRDDFVPRGKTPLPRRR